MDSTFDVRTGFMVLGILALASAAGGYAALRASLHRGNLLWLGCGLFFAAGSLLLALRPLLPPLLSFETAHWSLVGGLAGLALALHYEGRPELRVDLRIWGLCLGLPLLSALVFAQVRRVDPLWGIAYFATAVGVAATVVALCALRIWRDGRQPGAAIIALTFGLLALAMVGRIAGALTGDAVDPAFAPGLNQLGMLAAAFFTLVIAQVGYLGLQFERIARSRIASAQQAAAMAERARQTQLREAALRDLVEERNQLIQHLTRHETTSDLARFAMDLPHQLSQPLCASKLNLEGVLARLAATPTDPEVAQALRAIDASNERVLQLLQQLRLLLDSHDAPDRREVELRELIEQTVPILQGSFRDQAVALEVLPDCATARVHASPTQIKQLILILCVNALTWLQSASHARGQPAWVRLGLEVKDAAAHLTVESSAASRPPGEPAPERIDVGLAIATRIAQAHGGELSAIGPGAVAFRLSLPLDAPGQ